MLEMPGSYQKTQVLFNLKQQYTREFYPIDFRYRVNVSVTVL